MNLVGRVPRVFGVRLENGEPLAPRVGPVTRAKRVARESKVKPVCPDPLVNRENRENLVSKKCDIQQLVRAMGAIEQLDGRITNEI